MQNNSAYDFDYFSNTVSELKEDNFDFKVLVNKKYKKRTIHIKKILIMSFKIIIILSLIFSLLYSQTRVTELNLKIATIENQLITINSSLDYYTNDFSRKRNLIEIEEYAKSIGMVKADRVNITYIKLNAENSIIIQPTREQKIIDNIKKKLQHN